MVTSVTFWGHVISVTVRYYSTVNTGTGTLFTTVCFKKVHPYDFHDNNVKWKPIEI